MSDFLLDRFEKCRKGISKNLQKLPNYCLDFLLSIENYTSPLTRLNYSKDLEIFFDYIAKNIFHKNAKDITFSDLESLRKQDIEMFLSYLSYYEYNGKTYHCRKRI